MPPRPNQSEYSLFHSEKDKRSKLLTRRFASKISYDGLICSKLESGWLEEAIFNLLRFFYRYVLVSSGVAPILWQHSPNQPNVLIKISSLVGHKKDVGQLDFNQRS